MAATTNHNRKEPERPFEPCYLFFYGSLMDAEVLQTIAGLPEVPAIQDGSVTGFEMKMWGIYPTLIPCAGAQVLGTVWKVNKPGHFFRLQRYETSAYTWCSCEIRLSNGEILPGCRTFCWAGDVNSKELKQGKFDLEHYQKYFKASVVRKAPSKSLVWEYHCFFGPEGFTALFPGGAITRSAIANLHTCTRRLLCRYRFTKNRRNSLIFNPQQQRYWLGGWAWCTSTVCEFKTLGPSLKRPSRLLFVSSIIRSTYPHLRSLAQSSLRRLICRHMPQRMKDLMLSIRTSMME